MFWLGTVWHFGRWEPAAFEEVAAEKKAIFVPVICGKPPRSRLSLPVGKRGSKDVPVRVGSGAIVQFQAMRPQIASYRRISRSIQLIVLNIYSLLIFPSRPEQY